MQIHDKFSVMNSGILDKKGYEFCNLSGKEFNVLSGISSFSNEFFCITNFSNKKCMQHYSTCLFQRDGTTKQKQILRFSYKCSPLICLWWFFNLIMILTDIAWHCRWILQEKNSRVWKMNFEICHSLVVKFQMQKNDFLGVWTLNFTVCS